MGSNNDLNDGLYTKYETYWWYRPSYVEYKKNAKMDLPWEWSKEEAKLPEYQIYPRPNELRKMQDHQYASYFDSPDNTDCFKKLAFVTKYSLGIGALYTMFDTMLVTQPKTSQKFLTVAARGVIPLTAAAALASSVQCAVASFREKEDDMVSYLAGGASLGLFYGMKLGSSGKGAIIGVVGMLVAAFFKDAQQRSGAVLFPHQWHMLDYRAVNGQWGGQFGLDWRGNLRYHDPGGRRPY